MESSRLRRSRCPIQGRAIGRLLVTRRSPDQAFTAKERGLRADLARQAGVAAQAVRLTADLKRSWERLVRSREEERRRPSRDLHAKAGPSLAGMIMQVGVVRALLRQDREQDAVPGVGLASMRERAEELGGEFSVGRPPQGGRRVRAVLPPTVGGR